MVDNSREGAYFTARNADLAYGAPADVYHRLRCRGAYPALLLHALALLAYALFFLCITTMSAKCLLLACFPFLWV